MFRGSLPNVPALYLRASVTEMSSMPISATGIGASEDEARLRHDNERVERLAILTSAPKVPDFVYGYAAGDDDGTARRALCEMIERWRVAEWWEGRICAVRSSVSAAVAFEAAGREWPRSIPRHSELLQLEPDDLPPVFIALSWDVDGQAVCTASACGTSITETAKAVLRELYQMEFGLAISQRRAAHGMPLSNFDQGVLKRAAELKLTDIDALTDRDRTASETTIQADLQAIQDCLPAATQLEVLGERQHVVRAAFCPPPATAPSSLPAIVSWPFYVSG